MSKNQSFLGLWADFLPIMAGPEGVDKSFNKNR
jgi:hypothetical protein